MTHKRQSERAFGLTFAVVFLIVAGLGRWLSDATPGWALAVALALAVIALAVPWLLLPFNRLWGVLSRRLGLLTNFLLLGLFFYLIMLPVGVVMRWFGRDPVQRRSGAESDSYFTAVTRHADAETFSDMF